MQSRAHDPSPAHPPASVAARIALPAAAASGAVAMVLVATLVARPIADDYLWLGEARDRGGLGFTTWFLERVTGRYSNAVLMGSTSDVLGERAVQLVPAALLLLLLAATVWLVATLLRITLSWSLRDSMVSAMLLGLVSTGAVIAATPSIYDSFLWYNSVCIFLASLVAIIAVGAGWLHLESAPRSPLRVSSAVLAIAAFAASGFAESTAAILGAIAGIVIVVRLVVKRAGVRLVPAAAVLVGAIAGAATVLLLPGTSTRLGIQDELFEPLSLGDIVAGTVSGGLMPLTLLTSWRAAAVILVAVVVWIVWREHLLRRPVLIGATALFFALVPAIANALLLTLTVHSQPYRAQLVVAHLSVIAFGVLLAVILAALGERVARVGAAVAAAAALAFVVAVALPLSSVATATFARYGLERDRDLTIKAAVESGGTISVYPAPLLLASTEASEIPYNDDDLAAYWLLPAIADFYGVDDERLVIDQRQPVGYCTTRDWSAFPDNRDLAVYYGVSACGAER